MYHNQGLWTFVTSVGAITFLSLAGACLYKRKKEAERRKVAEAVLSSPASAWKKVGRVKELIIYPLKSGRGKNVDKCDFKRYGMSLHYPPGVFALQDRMFIVYDEETKRFATAREYPKLLLVDLTPIDESHAKLEAPDAPALMFELPQRGAAKIFKCSMWFGEPVAGVECGPEVATWFSRYLLDKDSGVSLGTFLPESKRSLVNGVWKEQAKHYQAMRDDDAGLFADLVSYMIMSQASLDVLNEKMQKPIPALQLRPNVVVDGCEAHAEDDWEWIRIGNDAVIRMVKPCARCAMTRIDPYTAVPDPKAEILQVLRSYRKHKDPKLDKLENYAPVIGTYCGLYREGAVKLDDDVYVYQPSN